MTKVKQILFKKKEIRTKNTTDLTAEILTKTGETLLVEAQQREDLEKPFHLCKVDCCYSFIQLLSNNDLQFLLCLLKHYQTGIHSTACADMMALTVLQGKPRHIFHLFCSWFILLLTVQGEKYKRTKKKSNEITVRFHCSARLPTEQCSMTENWRPHTFFSLPAQLNNRLVQREVSMDVGSSLFVVFVT